MKNLMKEDVRAKIICLIFAFTMWLYVMSENPVITSEYKNIQVNISNLKDIKAAGLVLAPDTEMTTKIMLKGRRSSVSELEKIGFRAYGIITEPKEGTNVLKLALNIEDSNVEYSLSPSSLKVVLEKDILEKKPVQIDQKGSLDSSFQIDSVKRNPPNVYVEGPKSLVDKIVSMKATLDITGNNRDFSQKLQVFPVDKDGNVVSGVKLNEDFIFVHAVVVQSKTVPVQLKLSGKVEGNLRLSGYTINPQEILIQGPADQLRNITQIDTKEVDVNELLNTPNYTVKLNIPDKVRSDVTQVKVDITSEQLITKEFDISKDRIKIRENAQTTNISDSENLPQTVKVKLTFSANVVEDIAEEDIELYVKMQDIEKDPAKVPLFAELTKPYETIEIAPAELNLSGQR